MNGIYKFLNENKKTENDESILTPSAEMVYEGYEGVLEIIYETTEAWNALTAIRHEENLVEAAALIENADQATMIALSEKKMGKALKDIAAWFAEMGKKVMAFFKNTIEGLSATFTNDVKFLEKYGDILDKAKPENIKYEGYPFFDAKQDLVGEVADLVEVLASKNGNEYLKFTAELEALVSKGEKADTKEFKQKLKEFTDENPTKKQELYALVIGKDGEEVSNSEFKKAVMKKLGMEKKVELTEKDFKVSEEMLVLKDSKDTIKFLKELQSQFSKDMKNLIKSFKKIQKDLKPGKDAGKTAQELYSLANDVVTIAKNQNNVQVTLYGYGVKAIKARRVQAIGLLKEVLKGEKSDKDDDKKKKKTTKESTEADTSADEETDSKENNEEVNENHNDFISKMDSLHKDKEE